MQDHPLESSQRFGSRSGLAMLKVRFGRGNVLRPLFTLELEFESLNLRISGKLSNCKLAMALFQLWRQGRMVLKK